MMSSVRNATCEEHDKFQSVENNTESKIRRSCENSDVPLLFKDSIPVHFPSLPPVL